MSLLNEAREAWRYRDLLHNLVARELQVRYKNSILGVAWSLANPIVRAFILYCVFTFVVQLKVDNYAAYILAAFFPWTYFLTGVLDAADSVSKQMALVKKVYFPRELLPLATTIANLRHFLLSLGVLAVYVIYLYTLPFWSGGIPIAPPREILLLPILVIMQTLLIAGIALTISALNVFFEDIKFLTAVFLDLLFYGVPIIYFIEQVQHTTKLSVPLHAFVYQAFLLNPMTIILIGYRSFLFHPQVAPLVPGSERTIPVNVGFGGDGVSWGYFYFACIVSVAVFLGGYAFFNGRKWRFVERM